MRLLLDENLSPKLAEAVQAEHPGSTHVRTLGLKGAADATIWERARREGYAILSKDNDFRQLSFLHGAPPKVVWLAVEDADTETILRLVKSRTAEIEAFEADPEASLLVLRPSPATT